MSNLDNKQQGMSVATATMPQQQNNFAQTLSQSSSTASAPAPTSAPVTTPAPGSRVSSFEITKKFMATWKLKTGSVFMFLIFKFLIFQGAALFGGVFHRGFFSKPVERTEEENYRYLMALDR